MATTESAGGAMSAPERNHYFYGKLLTASELEKEQHYFLEQRRLLHRLTLGRGVVCGLDLADDGGQVTIGPGLAIDGWGREIVVPETVTVDPRQPTDEKGCPVGAPFVAETVEICLAYAERCADLVPVLVPECELGVDEERCSPCTVLESFCVVVRQAQAGGPPPPPACDPALLNATNLHDVLCQRLAEAACSEVPADPCVPLGRVVLGAGTVDPCAGRELVYAPRLLFDLVLCLTEQVKALQAGQRVLHERAEVEAMVTFRALAGDAQSAAAGTRLPISLKVELTRGEEAQPLQGTRLEVEVTAGGGRVGRRALRTGQNGQARTYWQLGPEIGEQSVVVRVVESDLADRNLALSFRATALEP